MKEKSWKGVGFVDGYISWKSVQPFLWVPIHRHGLIHTYIMHSLVVLYLYYWDILDNSRWFLFFFYKEGTLKGDKRTGINKWWSDCLSILWIIVVDYQQHYHNFINLHNWAKTKTAIVLMLTSWRQGLLAYATLITPKFISITSKILQTSFYYTKTILRR